ncbi:hypothetical protein ACG7TL_005577 [Trametes sanguinea]
MFPLNDFNFVACALATVSAASTIPKSSYELHEGPLKRKRSVSTTVNEDPASPPLKRQKTPEMEDHEQVAADVMAIMPSSPAPADTITQAPTDTAVEFDVDPSKAELEIVPELTTEKIVVEEPSCQTEPPRNIDTVPRAFSWSTAQTIVAAKPSAAFNAFSGATSAFADVSTASSRAAPAWSASVGDINTIAPTSGSDPLAALSYATSTQTIVTGEEDERVIAEVKGAKVYIKRGERDFCEGILGNVKLLRHKDSRQERIQVFRREPVMKVSMNVRLQPLVRCTFDEAQGLLRVTLKEPIEGSQQDQVVVYAMKRGQSSKADFADFAHSVLESSRLCAQVPA